MSRLGAFEDHAPLAALCHVRALPLRRKRNTIVFYPERGFIAQPGVSPCEYNEQGRHPGYVERKKELPRSGYIDAVNVGPGPMESPPGREFSKASRVALARGGVAAANFREFASFWPPKKSQPL